MVRKEDFEKGFEECINGALSEEKDKRYRNAVELYYKALVQLIDFIIFEERGDMADYHKQRSEILKELNGDIENIRLGSHTLYRQTYYKTDFNITDCKGIKNGIKQIIQLKQIKGKIKDVVERI